VAQAAPPGQGAVAIGVTHVPTPSHAAAARSWPAAHIGTPQIVPGGASRHAPAPSQAPSRPQAILSGGHRPAEEPPAWMGRQRPSGPFVFAIRQEKHAPVQALSQHTPSMQAFDEHSLLLAHGAPLPFWAVHTPAALQVVPATQSPSPLQTDPRHAVADAHTVLPAHATAAAMTQVPAPSQAGAARSCAFSHEGDPQTVPAAKNRHPPAPSQVPSRPQAVISGVHFPADDPPALIGLHRPLVCPVSAFEQDMQAAVQALSQHNPPTHWPCAHSSFVRQADPSAFLGAHVPAAVQ